MAPSGKYTLPLNPNRLVRKYRKATPTPTPLTHEQIEYLVAKASAKTQKNQLGVSEPWTAVPNPVPDTGIYHSVKYSALSVSSLSPPPIIHSLLAPLPTTPPSATLTSTKPILTPSTTVSLTPTIAANKAPPPSSPYHIPTAAISLIAVAGAFLLVGCFVIIKISTRPPRRPHLVPSRPILDDPFPEDDEFETKLDSPLFGGKERLSERPGNSGLWNWTQYSTPATTTAVTPSTSGDNSTAQVSRSGTQGKMSYAGRNEKNPYPFTEPSLGVPNTQTPANSPYPAPMQQVHSAFTRAASRLSMASASIYPGSPSSNPNYGLVTAFTADGYPVMERVNPRVLQRSRSSTVGERNSRDRLQSRATRYSYGAYDGAEVMSPQLTVCSPTIPVAPVTPGRTRIKSSYFAHPRTSAMPPTQSTKAHVREDNRSEDHNSESRDNQGLASALGFGSPATVYPSSPQPSLYPDDSLSVVEAKRPSKRVHKKPAPNRASRVFGGDEHRLPAASPTVGPTAALGSLMLMDFGGESAVHLDLTSTSSMTLGPKRTVSRSDDKPPRVPSPPPLPSLTQMGLQHANPEAYAEYRSPTYSIYGLYETADRKSRVGSLHG
jgi:hypothetical protein